MNKLKLVIKSILGEEKKVLLELDRLFQYYSFCKEDCAEVKSAVAEACLNAIEHGNRLIPELDVDICIDVHRDMVRVLITDRGLGPKSLDSNNALSDRGWGIFFISQFMDYYCSYFLKEQTIFMMERKMKMEEG